MKNYKFFCFVLAIVLSLGLMIPVASASEGEIEHTGNVIVEPATPSDLEVTGDVDTLVPDIMSRSSSRPTSYWNLGNGAYNGNIEPMLHFVYTNYYFTCNSTGKLKITLNTSWAYHPNAGFNSPVKVRCIRKSDGVTVASTTYPNSVVSSTMTASGLSSSKDYYFKIELTSPNSVDSIKGPIKVARG